MLRVTAIAVHFESHMELVSATRVEKLRGILMLNLAALTVTTAV
jgi:hypothetical protein